MTNFDIIGKRNTEELLKAETMSCGTCPAQNFCIHGDGILISECKETLTRWGAMEVKGV